MPSDFGSEEQLVQKYHKWKTRLLLQRCCLKEKPISELKINAVKQILLLLVSTNRPQQIEWKQLEKTNYSPPLLWTTYVEFTYECDNDVYVHSTTNTTTISNHWAHPSTGQTKCNKSTFEIQQRQLRSMAPFVAASQLKADETMILLDRYSHYQQSWCTAYNCVWPEVTFQKHFITPLRIWSTKCTKWNFNWFLQDF